MVSKVFAKLVNNRTVNHLEKCGFPSGFQYGFRSSRSTADLLTGLGLLELWHLIYLRLLTGLGMLVFFIDLSLVEFQVRYLALFLLFSVIDGFEWCWMGSLHKNIQLMLEFIKAPFMVLHFSYRSMTLLMMLSVIFTIYADDTTLYSKCGQTFDLWQQLELASELESNLQDTGLG